MLISRICSTPIEYIRACCPGAEGAGVRHLVFVRKSYDPTLFAALEAARLTYNASPQDPADDATYIAAVNTAFATAETAGVLNVITNIMQGAKADPSRTEAPGAGDANVTFTGADHVLTWLDRNLSNENSRFYGGLKYQQDWVLYYVTATMIHRTPTSGAGSGELSVPEGKADVARYVCEWRWSSAENEWHYPRPNDLLNCTGEPLEEPPVLASLTGGPIADGEVPGSLILDWNLPADMVQADINSGYAILDPVLSGTNIPLPGLTFDENTPGVITTELNYAPPILPAGDYKVRLIIETPDGPRVSSNAIDLKVLT